MPTLPALTPEQRSAALAKAAVARTDRAQYKQGLKAGSVSLNDLIEKAESDDIVGRMKVKDVISSMPKMGPQTTAKLMQELNISETRRMKGLGAKQKEQLLARFK